MQDCTSSTTGRGTDRERCKEGASVGGTGRRSARSAQPGNPREPGLLEIARDSRSGEGEPYRFFNLIFEMMTVYEYIRMMRARQDRIRTFMQLELEACLEEVSWSIRCYNCEVLDCPQEEYPARLLPTLPPNYEGNLQNRLRRAQKSIFPASLKMILKSEYQLPVLRSVSEISVQPDSVIGEHRAGENSRASECDCLGDKSHSDALLFSPARCSPITLSGCTEISDTERSTGSWYSDFKIIFNDAGNMPFCALLSLF